MKSNETGKQNIYTRICYFFGNTELGLRSSSRQLVLGAVACGLDGYTFGFGSNIEVVVATNCNSKYTGYEKIVEDIYAANSNCQPDSVKYIPEFIGNFTINSTQKANLDPIDIPAINAALSVFKSSLYLPNL